MVIRLRTVFLFLLGVLVVWFLYAERTILTPFILAGIFAYLCNPIVDFASKKLRLPRTLAILFIYVLFVGLLVLASITLTSRILEESLDLRSYTGQLLSNANVQIKQMPDWLRPTAYDFLFTLKRSRFLNFFGTPSFFPLFSQAIARIVSFLIFLFSGYYFLKDGRTFFEKIRTNVPERYRVDVEILLKKINALLSGYLRGQIFLVFLMSIVTFIALTIVGVRFSLLIAIFSGFAEIVPVIGPIVAASLAVLVVLLTGSANFGLNPINASFVVILIYFVLRHLEDYFVIPYVMGKITKLPPFVIFFAVIAGGHLWGILGLILAVPIAAIIRLLLEFFFNQINGAKKKI